MCVAQTSLSHFLKNSFQNTSLVLKPNLNETIMATVRDQNWEGLGMNSKAVGKFISVRNSLRHLLNIDHSSDSGILILSHISKFRYLFRIPKYVYVT